MENEDKKIGCTGRCENCNVNQRTYCASQMAFYAQSEISTIKSMLLSIINDKFEDRIIVLRDDNKELTDQTE